MSKGFVPSATSLRHTVPSLRPTERLATLPDRTPLPAGERLCAEETSNDTDPSDEKVLLIQVRPTTVAWNIFLLAADGSIGPRPSLAIGHLLPRRFLRLRVLRL